MGTKGELSHREILSQPEVWIETLAVLRDHAGCLRSFFAAGRYDTVLFAGCGSTYYLSLAASATLQTLTGVPARGLPSSEVWLSPDSAYTALERTLLVAVSRSGETTETLRACEAFHRYGKGEILTLSCYRGAALTEVGEVNLVFPAAREESIAQTRSFSALYLAAIALAALWSGRDDLFAKLSRLPAIAHRLMATYAPLVQHLGEDGGLDRFYFLGSGPRYGLACELSLKMKEMSLSHSEPFHFLEFRHGPKSMVTASTLVVGLASQAIHGHEHAVLEEIRGQGGAVLEVGEAGEDVAFRSGLDETICGALYLPIGQLLAFARAASKGLNPDLPKHLTAVVRLP